jgi:hypothetical protein
VKTETTTTTASSATRPRKPGAWRRFIPYVIVGALVIAIVTGLRPRVIEVETATVTPYFSSKDLTASGET